MNELLRTLPRVDDVLAYIGEKPDAPPIPRAVLLDSIREVLDQCRMEIKKAAMPLSAGEAEEDTAEFISVVSAGLGAEPHLIENIAQSALALAGQKLTSSLRPVINATGIVLHTNLGRAPMTEGVAEHVKQVAMGYSTLEYDLQTAKRGSRSAGIEKLLTTITGAEAACIVNNNAAAVLLALSALCAGGEVVVSRGELVEIGGSFRIPEVIAQGGAILREVGATNKTHAHDYRNAIGENTAALLKVHTSNYKVMGFAAEVDLAEMVRIAASGASRLVAHSVCCSPKHPGTPPPTQKANVGGVLSIYDLGSGSFLSFAGEPTVQQAVASGVDILCFSGDKLLGGPQCGIVLGKKEHIAKLQKHPLYRALRADKLSLAALEATLILYQDMEYAKEQIPTLSMLFATPGELKEKATRLMKLLGDHPGASIQPTSGLAGGGALPLQQFQSWAVAIHGSENFTVQQLENHLRNWHIPIIARICDNALLLDVRTIEERHFAEIVKSLS